MKIQSILQSIRGRGAMPRWAIHPIASCLAGLLLVAGNATSLAQGVANSFGPAPGSGSASLAGGNFSHGDQAYRVVRATDYSEVNLGSSPANLGSVAQTGWLLGGSSCDGGCDSGCDSHGGSGFLGSHFVDHSGSQAACRSCGSHRATWGGEGGSSSCPRCQPYWYGSVEALYMERSSSSRFSASPDFFLSDFDFEWAPRVTVGYVPDCVNGYEISFTGRFDFDRVGFLSDPAGGIRSLLTAVPPVEQSGLSAFNNATDKAQFYQAQYWSVEASNTIVGWDVAKLICGIRYIDYDENFTIISRNTTNQVGLLRSNINNQMLGFQVGMDLLYPICHRTYTDFRTRAGLYANFVDLDFLVVNDGAVSAALRDDSTKIAGQFEVGTGVRYQFTDCLSIRAGVELWYFTRMASAKDQFSDGILARYTIRAKDDFVIAGLNVGAEYRF